MNCKAGRSDKFLFAAAGQPLRRRSTPPAKRFRPLDHLLVAIGAGDGGDGVLTLVGRAVSSVFSITVPGKLGGVVLLDLGKFSANNVVSHLDPLGWAGERKPRDENVGSSPPFFVHDAVGVLVDIFLASLLFTQNTHLHPKHLTYWRFNSDKLV